MTNNDNERISAELHHASAKSFGADGESRTLNLSLLRRAPLPIGLRRLERFGCGDRSRTYITRFKAEVPAVGDSAKCFGEPGTI